MSLRARRIVVRCVISGALFASTYNMNVPWLEHAWAVLGSHYPGFPNVQYWYDADSVEHPDIYPFFAQHPYANMLRWNGPKRNYEPPNRENGAIVCTIYTTRCTYFQVWAMIVPFFVTRRTLWSVVKAVLIAGLLASSVNYVRVTMNTACVFLDIPWWLAHDVPNVVLGLVTLGLSMCYFLRTLPAVEATQNKTVGRTLPNENTDRS